MASVRESVPKFQALFDGLKTAYGTGNGEWVKRPHGPEDWARHLLGQGPGLGIGPLRPDSTVMFAAIDLDEPDFVAAFEMQEYIPGTSFVERSRSGNAHVWVFFEAPLEAWVAMGVLKEAVLAAGKEHVEIFPKNHDFTKVRLGNYINLPYHGTARPIVECEAVVMTGDGSVKQAILSEVPMEKFIHEALSTRNSPEDWRRKARYLLVNPPDQRESTTAFGEQSTLHTCADHVLSGSAGIVTRGSQNMVLFMLAKCLTNWRDVDHDEALALMRTAVDSVFDPKPSDSEVRRILANVERGQYTSTGCDDPLVLAYAHPECPIANPRSR